MQTLMKKLLLPALLCLLTACTQTAVIEAHYGYYLYQEKTYDTFTDIPIPENAHVEIGLVKATNEQEREVKKEALQRYDADKVTFYRLGNSAHYMLPPAIKNQTSYSGARNSVDALLGYPEKEEESALRPYPSNHAYPPPPEGPSETRTSRSVSAGDIGR